MEEHLNYINNGTIQDLKNFRVGFFLKKLSFFWILRSLDWTTHLWVQKRDPSGPTPVVHGDPKSIKTHVQPTRGPTMGFQKVKKEIKK